MNLLDIKLCAMESNWRLFMIRKADPAFLSFQEKIFQRDDYRCQFCGFRAEQFQEVINLDGNCQNNKLNNLVTACVFCAQCFFIEAIGKSDFGGGSLIYLPEMSQSELNAFCHVLFASLMSQNSYSQQAKNIYRSLRLRTQQVEQHLGEGFSNPATLGAMLIDCDVENVTALQDTLAPNLRVLPVMSRFLKQLDTWMQTGMQALTWDT